MLNTITPLLVLLPAAVTALAGQEDPRVIISTSVEMQAARHAGINDYTVDQSSSTGTRTKIYYERIPDTDLFRMVPLPEAAGESMPGGASPDDVRTSASALATGLRMIGPQLAQLPAGPATVALDNLVGQAVTFLEGDIVIPDLSDGTAEAVYDALALASFADQARLVGRETVGGREAFHLLADDLGVVQDAGSGGEFTLESVNLWMDVDEYVPLRLLMEGTLVAEDEARPVTIEKLDQKYRGYGPAGQLYESQQQTMRITGLMEAMTDDQRREIEEAKTKMAEMRQQIEALPPAQKQMIEGRIGPQMAQMEQLASGGTFEVVTTVNGIQVDSGPPYGRVDP